MKRTTPRRLLLPMFFAALLALAPAAAAQGRGDARAALTPFPDSQAVLYVNLDRIVNEAMPRVMPAAEYEKLLAEPQKVGLDVRGLKHAVVGVRFAEGAQAGALPEFVLLLHGDFNADTLLMAGRVALSAMKMESREESYGGKTLNVLNVEQLMKMGAPPPPPPPPVSEGKLPPAADGQAIPETRAVVIAPAQKPFPYPEIAVTAFDANTIVVGVPAYVRATVDSMSGGQGRLRSSMLNLAATDPQALWSLSAELPPGLAQMLQKIGMPSNAEAERIIGWLRGVSFSQGMDALNFTVRAAVLTDSPEHASAISGLVNMGILAAQTAATQDVAKKKSKPDESKEAQLALAALRTFTNRIDNGTVLLGVTVPQSTVAEFVKREMTPKPPVVVKKKPTPRRRARRR